MESFWNSNNLNYEIAAIIGDYRCFEENCYVHAFSTMSNINSHTQNKLKCRGRILSEKWQVLKHICIYIYVCVCVCVCLIFLLSYFLSKYSISFTRNTEFYMPILIFNILQQFKIRFRWNIPLEFSSFKTNTKYKIGFSRQSKRIFSGFY
jgi:hypothetical protein